MLFKEKQLSLAPQNFWAQEMYRFERCSLVVVLLAQNY